MKQLIVYYSTYGNVYKMAQLLGEGAKEVPGVEPVVRRVPELIPAQVIDSRPDMKAGCDLQQAVPLVTLDDFREAGANRIVHIDLTRDAFEHSLDYHPAMDQSEPYETLTNVRL